MRHSTSPAPLPEFTESFHPTGKTSRLFSAELAKRLQKAEKSSKEPLIQQAAKSVLMAERNVVEILLTIHQMEGKQGRPKSLRAEPMAEVFQFPKMPTIPKLEPIRGLNPDDFDTVEEEEVSGFQPIMYKNIVTSETEDLSGLEIFSCDPEDDEVMTSAFDLDDSLAFGERGAGGKKDEWDELNDRIACLNLWDAVLRSADAKDARELEAKLAKDPNFVAKKKK